MAKWADYLISAVQYESGGVVASITRRHISTLMVHEDLGETVDAPTVWSREQVVQHIKARKTFKTIIKNTQTGQWNQGEDVRIFPVNGVDYLRTDANRTGADNLESLPEF